MRMLFISGNTHTVAGPSTFCWRTRRKNGVSVGVMVRFAGNLANFSKKLLIRTGNKKLKDKVYSSAYFLASLPGLSRALTTQVFGHQRVFSQYFPKRPTV